MFRVLILAALLAAAPLARACGYCVEDKMASVYDHAVVTAALGKKHQVAFFHVEGALPPGEEGGRALERLAGAASGVDPGSARASAGSASLSVAFDPRRTPVMKLQQEIERKLAARKLSLMLLQVMDRPAEFSPSVSAALKRKGL